MLPGSTNILDQLLGGFETKPSGTVGATGVSAEGQAPSLLFGDLLSLVSSDLEAVNQTGELAESGKRPFVDILFPSNDQPAAQDGAPAGPTENVSLLIEAAENQAAKSPNVLDLPAIRKETLDLLRLQVSERANLHGLMAQTDVEPVGEEQFNALVSGAKMSTSLVDLKTALQPNLQPAVYQILDSRVVAGQLELTVVADGRTEEPVIISVPTDLLSEPFSDPARPLVSNVTGRMARIPIDGMTKPKSTPIDELLSKLNLQTLEVKTEPQPATAKAKSAPLEIKLVADNDGAQIAIKGKLSQQDIRIKSRGKTIKAVPEFQAEKNESPLRTANDPLAPRSVSATETVVPTRRVASSMRFDLPERLLVAQNQNIPETLPFSAHSGQEIDADKIMAAANRNVAPSVKLTLPDLIQKPLSSSGQTIIIRIEPDHLGPARLNLTFRDQMLTARVIVDTPMAKMAVEGSLQQLTDQLSRAGIELDKIEVMLSGGDAREQFFDRRPAWSHARKLNRRDDEPGETPGISGVSQMPVEPPREYIRADAVNLLA
jgi:hypothetical protein